MDPLDQLRITREEVAKCERWLGKPVSEDDQVWIWRHVGRMLERREARDKAQAEDARAKMEKL